MSNLSTLHFYATPEHDCSYLDDHKAKTLFVDPHAKLELSTYSQLSDMGFRRSGKHIYRPHCEGCNACISARVPVQLFQPSKSQKRIINKNRDLRVTECEPKFTQEYYALYSRYINQRHADGDMYPPNLEQFTSFLIDSAHETSFFEFRDQEEKLIAVSVVDRLERGLSAIYTFYNPEMEKRSLGTYCILWQLAYCKEQVMDYLYLGYWVKACRKMNYKIAYKPIELLIDQQWMLFRAV